MQRITETSPSKINLFLKIKGMRDDLYHEIVSLMIPLNLYDTIIIEKNIKEKTTIECREFPELENEDNSVFKSVRLFCKTINKKYNFKIIIKKRIPVGSGLGGHSSNAASTLLGLNKMFGFPLSIRDLHTIATKISSDCPFFLYRKPAVVSGRGEIVYPLKNLPEINVIIIYPNFRTETEEIYSEFDKLSNGEKNEWLTKAKKTGKNRIFELFEDVLCAFNIASIDWRNDLELVLFKKFPELEKWKEKLLLDGADYTSISGSGSCIFGVFEKSSIAKGVFDKLKKEISLKEKVFFCSSLK